MLEIKRDLPAQIYFPFCFELWTATECLSRTDHAPTEHSVASMAMGTDVVSARQPGPSLSQNT
jgi:hypothetical protein